MNQPPNASSLNRREFLAQTATATAALAAGAAPRLAAQARGERPPAPAGVTVLNPRDRVPVGIIIDDSTCLVNLNRFTMPQFNEAWEGKNPAYHRAWKTWPAEIPTAFVRRFAEWALDRGVKGKYSIVPYPACVGRVDRLLPGWSQAELNESLATVRELLMPNWDIHPEMVTHTRVIDLRTGQPYPDGSRRYMENWDWSAGISVDEMTAYLAYALQILKNAGLQCEGLTTPGGFGSRARPQLAQGTLDAARSVFGAEVPHYFRDAYGSGPKSVAPRVELASGLDGGDPRCVVSIVACTGDWTGGWDCVSPGGVDRFITPDLRGGRVVEILERNEPALMLCHWTGVYWNGQELGFAIWREVERRLRAGYADRILWMKLAEVARYWAARELTRIEPAPGGFAFHAPFACPAFTIAYPAPEPPRPPVWETEGRRTSLRETERKQDLAPGRWWRGPDKVLACFDLPKGRAQLRI